MFEKEQEVTIDKNSVIPEQHEYKPAEDEYWSGVAADRMTSEDAFEIEEGKMYDGTVTGVKSTANKFVVTVVMPDGTELVKRFGTGDSDMVKKILLANDIEIEEYDELVGCTVPVCVVDDWGYEYVTDWNIGSMSEVSPGKISISMPYTSHSPLKVSIYPHKREPERFSHLLYGSLVLSIIGLVFSTIWSPFFSLVLLGTVLFGFIILYKIFNRVMRSTETDADILNIPE